MLELKPCPFCGSEAVMYSKHSGYDAPFTDTAIVECSRCSASVCERCGTTKGEAEEKEAADWNRRCERECRIVQIEPGWWECDACGSSIDWDSVDEPPACNYCP